MAGKTVTAVCNGQHIVIGGTSHSDTLLRLPRDRCSRFQLAHQQGAYRSLRFTQRSLEEAHPRTLLRQRSHHASISPQGCRVCSGERRLYYIARSVSLHLRQCIDVGRYDTAQHRTSKRDLCFDSGW